MFCIDADCALEFLMSDRASGIDVHNLQVIRKEGGTDPHMLLPDWAYAPNGEAHLMTMNREERCQRQGISNHLIEGRVPKNSFILLNDKLAIPSPELCFLRLASILSLPELVKAGMLLTSNFAFDESGSIVRRRKALTSKKELEKFTNNIEYVHGIRNARNALRYVTEVAASPPEIDTCILLTLKPSYGGYSFPKCELNGEIKLNETIARSLGYKSCYCDLLWRDQKCAVEYTSKLHHEGYEKQARDEIRRVAIESKRYRVFFLTKNQLYSQPAFEGFLRPLMQQLGKRMAKPTPKILDARIKLRKTLLYDRSWIIERACRNV